MGLIDIFGKYIQPLQQFLHYLNKLQVYFFALVHIVAMRQCDIHWDWFQGFDLSARQCCQWVELSYCSRLSAQGFCSPSRPKYPYNRASTRTFSSSWCHCHTLESIPVLILLNQIQPSTWMSNKDDIQNSPFQLLQHSCRINRDVADRAIDNSNRVQNLKVF